jgi:predicted DNA-binding transcriptional regulator YafY
MLYGVKLPGQESRSFRADRIIAANVTSQAFLPRFLIDFTLPAVGNETASEETIEQYVTMDQAAAMVNKSKKTLERYLGEEKMPQPEVEGGGGKAHEWKWSTLRPWLEQTFGKVLPTRLPSRLPVLADTNGH